MKRKIYDRQFKIAAVKTALEDEVTVTQVANELCIMVMFYVVGLMNTEEYEMANS